MNCRDFKAPSASPLALCQAVAVKQLWHCAVSTFAHSCCCSTACSCSVVVFCSSTDVGTPCSTVPVPCGSTCGPVAIGPLAVGPTMSGLRSGLVLDHGEQLTGRWPIEIPDEWWTVFRRQDEPLLRSQPTGWSSFLQALEWTPIVPQETSRLPRPVGRWIPLFRHSLLPQSHRWSPASFLVRSIQIQRKGLQFHSTFSG